MDPLAPLDRALAHARSWIHSLGTRQVRPTASLDSLQAAFGGPLPRRGEEPAAVLDLLARAGEPGLMATAGPRFFGFVIGGSQPMALAADWLTSAWDQNAGLYVTSPTVAVLEETAGRWLNALFGISSEAGVGFVTGGQMANFTGLAAARHALLARAGWNVAEDGLFGAPELHVVVGEEVHVTVLRALRFLGLGQARVKRVRADAQGRMDPAALPAVLAGCNGPTLLCVQAGNVNSGAVDPMEPLISAAHAHGAWVHVDGAFGLWGAATPTRRPVLQGVEKADSWAVDAHKWLNVPYDSGVAIVRDREALRLAVGTSASYLVRSSGLRDGVDFVPEFSRRARGVPVYAALRALGRDGVEGLVDRLCTLAQRFAARLGAVPGVHVLNEVVLNQVLVRFEPPGGGDADAFTREVIGRVQADGTCWLGGSKWKGQDVMRISVSGWNTTEADVDRSVSAILRAAG
ncbi:MAG TPA: aminotransferase class V-fold PLP-dependent enzyme, partial [Myxococcaceae bacterium]|nr:aminotransferase class V-fold PLP-dependent enzyme [Myxococcaceae bacterium]